MYPLARRQEALRLLASGRSLSEVSRDLGISHSTLREWRERGPHIRSDLPSRENIARSPYAALLGYYLGDGCLSAAPRTFVRRVSCDRAYPRIIEDVTRCIKSVHVGSTVHRVRAPGVTVVQDGRKHWPCLFPQHGPGRKHERPIVLAAWQREIVAAYPWEFLRGLLHSDGARVNNWATRVVGGERRRYDYPRWQFVNASEDIPGLCTLTLDHVGVPRRRSGRRTVSVSTRAGVAALDENVGPKS